LKNRLCENSICDLEHPLIARLSATGGAVEDDDGGVIIYWGGADTVMCAGTARLDALVDLCLLYSRAPF
jgi:hypothetical protein